MKDRGRRGRRCFDVVYSHHNDAPETNTVKELPKDTHRHAQVEHTHLQRDAVLPPGHVGAPWRLFDLLFPSGCTLKGAKMMHKTTERLSDELKSKERGNI